MRPDLLKILKLLSSRNEEDNDIAFEILQTNIRLLRLVQRFHCINKSINYDDEVIINEKFGLDLGRCYQNFAKSGLGADNVKIMKNFLKRHIKNA